MLVGCKRGTILDPVLVQTVDDQYFLEKDQHRYRGNSPLPPPWTILFLWLLSLVVNVVRHVLAKCKGLCCLVICSYGLWGYQLGIFFNLIDFCTSPVSLLLGYLLKRTVLLWTRHGTSRVLPITRWCICHFDIFLYFRTTTYHVSYFRCFLIWYYFLAVLDSLFKLLLPCGCPSC